MCISTPKLDAAATAIPERQAARLPDQGALASGRDDPLRRRRALMATIFTSPGGTLGQPSTTAGPPARTTMGA